RYGLRAVEYRSEDLLLPPSLRALSGRLQGRTIDLTGDGLAIGRHPSNDLAIPDAAVSRHHCVLRRASAGWRVADLAREALEQVMAAVPADRAALVLAGGGEPRPLAFRHRRQAGGGRPRSPSGRCARGRRSSTRQAVARRPRAWPVSAPPPACRCSTTVPPSASSLCSASARAARARRWPPAPSMRRARGWAGRSWRSTARAS